MICIWALSSFTTKAGQYALGTSPEVKGPPVLLVVHLIPLKRNANNFNQPTS